MFAVAAAGFLFFHRIAFTALWALFGLGFFLLNCAAVFTLEFSHCFFLPHMKAGAEVFFSSCLMVHNIRYIIVDERIVVIGIPEITGEKEATGKGYRIPSEGLAMVLKNYFNTCEKQTSFADYLREVIEQTGATPEHIAREYQIEPDELKRIAGRSSSPY